MHAIGYVSAINEEDLKRIDSAEYAGTSLIGKLGVEGAYEAQAARQTGLSRDSGQRRRPAGGAPGRLYTAVEKPSLARGRARI